MKKKLVVLMMALAMVMTTACGSKEPADSNVDSNVEAAEGADAENAEAADADSADADDADADDAEADGADADVDGADTDDGNAEAADADGADAEDAETYVFGTFTENGYESPYVGYRFTAPEGYVLYSQEEMAQIMGISMDMISDDYDALQRTYLESAIVYDMMAANAENPINNINVVVQQMDTSAYTLETIVDANIQELSALTSMECNVSEDYEMVTFAGTEFAKLTAEVTANGVTINQEYYIKLLPAGIVTITITYDPADTEACNTMISAFEAL